MAWTEKTCSAAVTATVSRGWMFWIVILRRQRTVYRAVVQTSTPKRAPQLHLLLVPGETWASTLNFMTDPALKTPAVVDNSAFGGPNAAQAAAGNAALGVTSPVTSSAIDVSKIGSTTPFNLPQAPAPAAYDISSLPSIGALLNPFEEADGVQPKAQKKPWMRSSQTPNRT